MNRAGGSGASRYPSARPTDPAIPHSEHIWAAHSVPGARCRTVLLHGFDAVSLEDCATRVGECALGGLQAVKTCWLWCEEALGFKKCELFCCCDLATGSHKNGSSPKMALPQSTRSSQFNRWLCHCRYLGSDAILALLKTRYLGSLVIQ